MRQQSVTNGDEEIPAHRVRARDDSGEHSTFLREFGPVTGVDVVGSGSFIVIDAATNNTVAAGMIA